MQVLWGFTLLMAAASAQYFPPGPRGNAPTITGAIAAEFAGVLKKIDGSKLYVELGDGNTMEFRTTRKTRITVLGKTAKLKDLSEGEVIEVSGKHGPGAIEAVVIVMKSKDKRP